MPQFQLNDNHDSRRTFSIENVDEFTKAYIEAFFWTNCDSGHEDEHIANRLGTRRLTKGAWKNIIQDCEAFQAHAKPALDAAYEREGYGGPEQAGHDFWLTRQGHGAGFWHRTALDENDLGRTLTKFAKKHREVNGSIYRGWIYHG